MDTATTVLESPTAPAEAPREGLDPPRLLPLREAAELCGLTHTAMRKRADRGGLETVKVEGVRHVPLSELERHGLLPDAELVAARRRVEELEAELATHRQLVESTERALTAEREATERANASVIAAAALARTAEERAAEHAGRLEELEERLARAGRGVFGPLRSWALAREIAELRAEGEGEGSA